MTDAVVPKRRGGSGRLAPLVRRGLHGWFLLSRGLTLGARAAVIDAENRVCLIRHTYTPGWQLPGGGIEIGEDAIAALARELREETEIEITGTPRLHGVFFNGHVSRRDHVLVFVVRDFTAPRPKAPDREIAECRFFGLGELPPDTTRGTRERLAEIAEGRVPAAFW
jgi:8-oxo-dGTP pyrophosphatase MutT (NUDIX family)